MRLMEAAVRIFAERGFQATSLRAVTQMAGTSVSAANYHFGSKAELLRAALRDRAGAMNDRRLALIAELEAAAGSEPPAVETILDAYLRPMVERLAAAQAMQPEMGAMVRGLALRLYVDPPEIVSEIRREVFDPVNRRFAEVLARALPSGRPAQLEFALEVTLGAWIHFLIANVPQADSVQRDPEASLEQMVIFLAAGIRAVIATAGDEPGEPS